MNLLSYTEAIDYLYSKAPLYSRIGKAAYKANLNNTLLLDALLHHPHQQYKTIHIAGTNGKGSVSHTLAAILSDAGYKTGLYTSPHIKDFCERIRVNGIKIKEEYIVEFVNKHKDTIEKIEPSFFEITTLLAFQYFADERVDIAIIETGLGGRLDSTNIIRPLLSIITNIGWDHADLLGNSLEQIASEKAGIIKKNIPVIFGEHSAITDKILINKAKEQQSEYFFAQDYYHVKDFFITQNNLLQLSILKKQKPFLPGLKYQLLGYYQTNNIPAILLTLDILADYNFSFNENNIYRGFKHVCDLTGFSGRWQIINQKPLTICDIGHNKPALEQNLSQLLKINKKKLYFVLGFMKDKDLNAILSLFPTDAYYFFVQADIPRSLKATELLEIAKQHNLKGEAINTPREALNKALSISNPDDVIYVGGSTYIVAEIL